MSHEPGDPGLPPGETRAAGALLSAAWGEPVAVLAAEALRDRPHVFRLRLDGGRSAVLKRRGPRDRARGAFGEAGIELGPDWDAAMAAAMAVWVIARGTALREALGEDDSWGTTTMRPRLLAWLRSFAAAAGRAGTLPRLRALAADLGEVLSQRWPQARVPDYPALAGPGAVLARVPDWWQPEG